MVKCFLESMFRIRHEKATSNESEGGIGWRLVHVAGLILTDCRLAAANITNPDQNMNDFVVGCIVCDNRTPMCDSLTEAISLWNQIYCCALPPYEIETA